MGAGAGPPGRGVRDLAPPAVLTFVSRFAALLLALVLMPPAALMAAQGTAPPALDLTLKPIVEQGAVRRVEVSMRMEAPNVAAAEPLLRLPITIVSIPTSAYEAEAISARDEAGPLPLTQREEPKRPEGVYRQYLPTRATQGDVLISYSAEPRRVLETTNNGPLFDMRAENGGFTSAGISFLALPVGERPYRTSIRWDLSTMAAGSIGLSSLGEGDIEVVGPAQRLAFAFYGAGPFRKHQAEPGGRLTLYTLSDTPFDVSELASRIGALYGYMADFFGDKEGAYRVFARRNPYRGTGGTALPRAFMFGYHPPSKPTVDQLQSMLAHEIAHGWLSMQGEHGETAWFSEGAAEYYSLILAYRAGVFDEETFLRELNRRAVNYYTHPFRSLTNEEAAARFWSDPFVQQVPYGRGFFYLAQTDGAIRAASAGRRSLDDVVQALRARQAAGQPYGNTEWLALVAQEISRERAERAYRQMTSGEAALPGSAFSPCFLAVPEAVRRLELGFARRSLNEGAVVQDLVPGSNAAKAGLREGDRIVTHTELTEITPDPDRRIELTIERDGRRRVITYLPRAELVEAFRFVRNPGIPSGQCRV